ncbi:glycosyltransferase family 39 protein [uncultured Lutibacter sp.]|uniref:ArnT family glycosyltransferase n=1 Tax=uncultured Lutibacter sp. TaxID=437739 RepID=UPI00261F95DF|nr:glycosyltransferase family 39 protein [uncultured Lutibacter sp.]
MLKLVEKYPLIVLFLVVIFMLLIHLNIPNVTIMEARNFITSREMINDGNWFLTTMNGEARYQKPPLPTWLTAFSGLIFGVNSLFALRLPAALMVLFLGVFAYFLSLKLTFSKKQSLQNSLILITSFYIFAIINEAPWDIFTHGFMLAGLYYLFRFFNEKTFFWKNALFSALFIGLSIMSKGPVSLYALFLPFIISYSFVYKYENFKRKLIPFLIHILLFIIIGGWWFIYVRIADANAFLEIASKETGNWSSYNVKPFYYYWSFFTQTGLWTIPAFISLIYPYLIKRVNHKKAYKFTFWWTISAVILLSIIPEKKPRYLVPVLIPLALNTGFYIQYLIDYFKNFNSKKERIPVYFNFSLISVIAISVPIILLLILKENITNYLISFICLSCSSIILSFLILKNLFQKNIQKVFYTTVFFMVTLFLFGLPISKHFTKNQAYNSINKLHIIELKNEIKSYSIGELTPELLWYYNGKIKNIYKNDVLDMPAENNFGILLMNKDVEFIKLKLANEYTFKLLDTYNLNFGLKNKERLIRQFYLVSKK